MDCQQVHEWLLHTDPADWEQANHLQSCPDCRAFAAEITRLEQGWREITLPASASTAKAKFLSTYAGGRETVQISRKPVRRLVIRSALAASILLAASVGGLLLLDAARARAGAALVDRLVDWNLELADAPSSTARVDIYDDRVDRLRTELTTTDLPDAERAFAEELLANATWLSENNDPTAEADRFAGVADHLLERMEQVRKNNNPKELRQLTRLYARVTELGLAPKLAQIKSSGSLDFDHMRRLEKVILKDVQRRQKLEALLERSPDATRKQIKKELDLPRKSGKRKSVGAATPGESSMIRDEPSPSMLCVVS